MNRPTNQTKPLLSLDQTDKANKMSDSQDPPQAQQQGQGDRPPNQQGQVKTPAPNISTNQQQGQRIEDKPHDQPSPQPKVEIPAQPSPAQNV